MMEEEAYSTLLEEDFQTCKKYLLQLFYICFLIENILVL